MVHLSRICYRKYGNLVDNLRLYVRGGSGGMGLPRLGGQGGKGGDVWMVSKKEVTLKRIKDKYPHKRFIGELNAEGDRLLVAKGGQGGSFHSAFTPSKGQTKHIRLDLKLIADVGLVGFPNAGKSSLLTVISHASPQIANYAFTTLRPEIGKVMYEDHKQISVADLPGLIEGAHLNKGMGHKFLKHVERTKQLLFVVDVCGFQLASKTPFRSAFEAVQLLTKELELYKEDLLSKPALLVVNKMDLPGAQHRLEELQQQLQNPEEFSHLLPEDMIPRTNLAFRDVVPVSTVTGSGIDQLKLCLRQSLDEDAARVTEALHGDRLCALRQSRAAIPVWGSATSMP
ncbi:GTP-binding protein 10 [Merluccius polli]|uniref:GTP-binding protein 10 n=1 Tax=Merluccius polli TaxID=89951 RepID=A0AA47P5X6_MERPO|nr:GTP-binding protein 10 [Merluccius polli]